MEKPETVAHNALYTRSKGNSHIIHKGLEI